MAHVGQTVTLSLDGTTTVTGTIVARIADLVTVCVGENETQQIAVLPVGAVTISGGGSDEEKGQETEGP